LNVPLATYRVQLNRNFDFLKLKEIVPYLTKLGISHIYASPIFKARADSMHGYDIVDPTAISEELGGKVTFEDLCRETAAYGLSWLQDIVPNHAAYSLENKRVFDVMQNGLKSRYAKFFDVDWNYPSLILNRRTLVPFLSKELSECIKQREISLIFDGFSFKVKYGNLEFPVNRRTNQELLQEKNIELTIKQYNNSSKLLTELLSKQYYLLAYWKEAFKEINYRRFFDILDLIGLRMEKQDVFEETHQLIFDLLRTGKVSGLRVDHVDGVHNPEEYLQNLHRHSPNTYLIIEKILTDNETLPETWPIQGSTGYDFINYVNGLFVKQTNEASIDNIYKQFTKNTQDFNELLFDCKNTVVDNYFMGDINNIAHLINQTLQKLEYNQFNPEKITNAVTILITCFSVYRTYLNPKNPIDKKGNFYTALKQAKQRNPELTKELDVIEKLLQQCPNNKMALETLMKLQQFTSAIMAKGLEDTAFYRYCRLLSLNEVGGNPSKFGVSTEEYHKFNLVRQNNWPLTLNASSTHDTKRGEDARARLNVLSEIPQELEKHLLYWAENNTKHKTIINGNPVPNHNEEYLIYQTLIGAYPPEDTETQEFTSRAAVYVIKALREAKVHTSWLNPNMKYENATNRFIQDTLKDPQFLDTFLPFQKQIAFYGFINSLSQTLLKITCPGIPDFYQGAELLDLNMVDPDNRRPVDYQKRKHILGEISKIAPSDAKMLLNDYTIGKAKLYLIFKALQVRRRLKALFEEGTYIPLTVEGTLKEQVVAFMRKKQGKFIVVVTPHFLTGLLNSPYSWKLNWEDTLVKLPVNTTSIWNKEFTDSRIHTSGLLSVDEVLGDFPVALLTGDNNV